ncbi:MAG TPA: hypothetical protein VKF60_07655 [Myxococcota bacterium]|nr:hypothetical protein [Myxococcota bacterium]
MSRIAVGLGLGLALAAARAHAVEVDYGDWKLDLSANLREIVTESRDLDAGDLPLDPNAPVPLRSMLLATTRARLQLEARYGDHWTGQIVYDNELFLGTGRDSLAFRLAEQLGAPTWLDLDHTIADSRDATWRHLLYRGWVRYQADALEVTVGRQRIALGRAQLWNPTDLFNPIPPLAVERDQRIGVDAALARVRLRDDLWAAAIFAPGVNDQNPSSAFRLELSRRELDGALMFALIDRDRVAGLDFSANVRDAALRGEFTETWHFAGRATLQAVVSLDYTFPLGTGLYGLVEHFYNQNVAPRDSFNAALLADVGLQRLAARFLSPTQITTVSRNQTGVELGYDLTPLLRANCLWIHDWNGPSEAFAPSLSWSPRSDLELSGGVQLFGGGAGSGEYGGLSPLYFLRADVYF